MKKKINIIALYVLLFITGCGKKESSTSMEPLPVEVGGQTLGRKCNAHS